MLKLLVFCFIIGRVCVDAWETFKYNDKDGQCNLNVSGCNKEIETLCCGSNYKCGTSFLVFWGACDSSFGYSICDSPNTNPCYMDTSSTTRTALQSLKTSSGYMSQSEFNSMSFTNSKLWFSPSLILSMGVGIYNDLTDHKNQMLITSMSFPTLTASFPISFTTLSSMTALTIVPTASIDIGLLLSNLPTSLESLTFSGNKIIGKPKLNLGTLLRLKKLQITNTLISGSFESVALPNSLTLLSINHNAELIGTVPADFYDMTTLDLQYNKLYGPINSKKFSCSSFNYNCIGTVTDFCSPITNPLTDCKCSAYSNDSTKCESLTALKQCDFIENAKAGTEKCRDFVDCTKQVSLERCEEVGKCTWCGHTCIESKDVCPLCSTYGESKCSDAFDPGSTKKEKCKTCEIGQDTQKKFYQCASQATTCPTCSDFYKNKIATCENFPCKYCDVSGYCVDSNGKCPTCYGYNENNCKADGSCQWCGANGNDLKECRIKESDNCRKDCSQLAPDKCDSDECTSCGTSCIQKGEICPECSTYNNAKLADCDQSIGPSGQCVNCGEVCKSSVSECPPCNEHDNEISCKKAVDSTETIETIKKKCHWCGSNMGCLTDKNACPSCNTYTLKQDCEASENPFCFFCPVVGNCVDKNDHCNYPLEFGKLFDFLRECNNIDFSEEDFTDVKDLYKLCTDFKDDNFWIDCKKDFSAFDTIKLVNPGLSSLSAINNMPARVINISQNTFTDKLDALAPNYDTLKELYLSNNNLGGTIPEKLTPSEVLDLSNNKLSGDVPSDVKTTIKKLVINNNLLTGYIGNCELYADNCFMDTGEGCDMKTLNLGCDCSVFASSEVFCEQISFCKFVSSEEEMSDEQGHSEMVTITECVRREPEEPDRGLPTIAIIFIAAGAFIIVSVGIVIAVIFTRRKKEYSSSSSSSVFETELDSRTGAQVTF